MLDNEVSGKHVLIALGALFLMIFVIVKIASNPPAKTGENNSFATVTLEYELATINAGFRVGSSDPAIYQFLSLLDSLERKCSNSRQQIADATVAAHEQLKEKGVRMTLMEVMRNLNNAIPAEAARSRVSIAEIAAAFVVLTNRAK
jgi:hypothetical protein